MRYIKAHHTKIVSTIIAAVCLAFAANGQRYTTRSASGSLGPVINTSLASLIPGAPHSIAFTSNRDGNNEIYLMNPDGGMQTRKTETLSTVSDVRPDISPDGTEIVFSSNRDGNLEIFIMNFDGSNVRQLTTTVSPVANHWPRWSPDGEWIAFQSGTQTTSPPVTDVQIYRIRRDGSDLTKLTDLPGRLNLFPAWSPDGTRLVIRRDNDIYLINSSDGSDPDRLTLVGTSNQMGSFSPDGTRIAFLSNREGYGSVFIMNSDGSNQVNFTPRPDGYAGTWNSRAPAWSSNNEFIYFTAQRSVGTGNLNEQIYVKPAVGGNETQLTTAGANFEATVHGVLATTAAGVVVSGRVMTPDGRGLRGARVTMVDSEGVATTILTSSLGYFTFEDVTAGETYVIGVASRRYRFDSRVIQVSDDLTNVDFTGLE